MSIHFPSRTSQSIILVVPDDHEYKIPQKGVKTPADVQIWENSEAYGNYMGFILALNEAVKGKPLSVETEISENTKKILKLLETVDGLIDEIPAVDQPQRFGNAAFRTFYTVLKDKALQLLQATLPKMYHRAIPEIQVYFYDGFGNSTRIDYGTGHEISFLMFLCCLFKIGVMNNSDKLAIVTRIIPKYLDVARKLQQTYRMEPAGSHGVWSLDDYQFIPFIFGSAQLINHPKIDPSAFLNETIVRDYAKDYMFLGCIDYINRVKTGPFAEHSNQLWGISGVPTWSKVNSGLIKMYKVEVLGKFPVVQHIMFGSLLPFRPAPADTAQTPRLSLQSSRTTVETASAPPQLSETTSLLTLGGEDAKYGEEMSETKSSN